MKLRRSKEERVKKLSEKWVTKQEGCKTDGLAEVGLRHWSQYSDIKPDIGLQYRTKESGIQADVITSVVKLDRQCRMPASADVQSVAFAMVIGQAEKTIQKQNSPANRKDLRPPVRDLV